MDVSPGPRATPVTATIASSKGKPSRPRPCNTGMSSTANALAMSATMLTFRAPTRSMIGPPSAFASTIGASSKATTRPVFVADPVVVSTNQGTAIALILVPATEIALAKSIAGRVCRLAVGRSMTVMT